MHCKNLQLIPYGVEESTRGYTVLIDLEIKERRAVMRNAELMKGEAKR